MGAIKFPHASGNSMSIAAPATNPASDLELKLPATVGTAGQVLQNSSTPGTLEFGIGGKIIKQARATSTTEDQSPSANGTWTLCGPVVTYTAVSGSNRLLFFHGHTLITKNTNSCGMKLMKDGISGTSLAEHVAYNSNTEWCPTVLIPFCSGTAGDTSSHTYQFAIYAAQNYANMRYNYEGDGCEIVILEVET